MRLPPSDDKGHRLKGRIMVLMILPLVMKMGSLKGEATSHVVSCLWFWGLEIVAFKWFGKTRNGL